MDNLNIPDFIDISAEATQAAITTMQEKNKQCLTMPPDGDEAAHWTKQATKKELEKGWPAGEVNNYCEWVEAVTIERAHRSISKNGHLEVSLMLRIRATSKHNPSRVFFGQKYILDTELKSGKLSNMTVEWLVSLLRACEMLPPDGVNARLLNILFPPKGQPGAASPLIGKGVMVAVCQKDNWYNGEHSRRDEARTFYPMPS
jgi:hypothetical protein